MFVKRALRRILFLVVVLTFCTVAGVLMMPFLPIQVVGWVLFGNRTWLPLGWIQKLLFPAIDWTLEVLGLGDFV